MTKKSVLLFTALFILMSMNIISAEIMFNSQPAPIYNINDAIDNSLIVKTTAASEGFIEISLNCNGVENNFYRSPLSLQAGVEEKVDKKLVLSKSFLNDMTGTCKIIARYNSEQASTQSFQISSRVDINLDVGSINVKPGEKIIIKGTATKANSQPLEGFLEVTIEGTEVRVSKSINQGKINANFSFPESLKSGSYNLVVIAYDKLNNEIDNSGDKTIILNLRQEPSKIEIEFDKQSIIPGDNIKIIPKIYDKANQEVQGDVKIDILDIYDDLYITKLIKTGEETTIKINANATPGYWKMEASSLGLKISRLFYIEELQKARFEISGDELIITNIGNVPYTKAVQIAIGNEVDIKEMNLDIGESKRYRLSGDGNYKVSVSDGTEIVDFGDMSLTGNIIGVMDLRKTGFFNQYPIVWLFLIIVFGLFILMMVERVNKRKVYSYTSNRKVEKKAQVPAAPLEIRTIKNAEHSLVLHGNKEEAALLNLKIKNINSIGQKEVKEAIERSLEDVGKSKGTIYRSGENFTGIFTPSITKTFRNDLTAIRVASEISRYLNEHNSKSKEKIDFGIGISSGNIVTKVDKNGLKFTPLGNSMNLARRISESAQNNVLLSAETSKKVMNDVKTEKSGEYYSIKKMLEREQHKKFIDGFLNRQSK